MTLQEFNKFTLHFATINTGNLTVSGTTVTGFTLHFATINTH